MKSHSKFHWNLTRIRARFMLPCLRLFSIMQITLHTASLMVCCLSAVKRQLPYFCRILLGPNMVGIPSLGLRIRNRTKANLPPILLHVCTLSPAEICENFLNDEIPVRKLLKCFVWVKWQPLNMALKMQWIEVLFSHGACRRRNSCCWLMLYSGESFPARAWNRGSFRPKIDIPSYWYWSDTLKYAWFWSILWV